MHNLVFLFAYKTAQVFQARVIHQIIDQNWDLKGFKCTLARIIERIGGRVQDLEKTIEKMINKQNLQSTSCIQAIGGFLRNTKKNIKEDDLRNSIETYQTTYNFLKEDIERYREQGIKHQCFQVLHPWAYDLDAVDMKYIVNNSLENEICKSFNLSYDSQLFWLSFFKPQLSCSADEF
jgi:chaperonin cofactor prefoldin